MTDWEEQALHMIEKTDGRKPPRAAVIDAVSQLIEENLNSFGYLYGIFQPACNPTEGIEYAKLRLEKALERLEGR